MVGWGAVYDAFRIAFRKGKYFGLLIAVTTDRQIIHSKVASTNQHIGTKLKAAYAYLNKQIDIFS